MKVTASSLNVRSGPDQNFRKLGELRRGDVVEVLERHEGWGWVEPARGWVSLSFLADEGPVFRAPVGLDGIRDLFGEPGAPMASAGRAKLPAPLKVGWADKSVDSFSCHALMAPHFTRVFQRLHDEGLWDELRTFDGCYNVRPIKTGRKASTHSWGISIDLNASTNRQGTQGDMSPRVVKVFEEEGFTWGGRFAGKSIDPMHFQFAQNY